MFSHFIQSLAHQAPQSATQLVGGDAKVPHHGGGIFAQLHDTIHALADHGLVGQAAQPDSHAALQAHGGTGPFDPGSSIASVVHAQSAQTVPAHVHALADHGMLSATHFSSTCGDYNI